MTRIQHCAAPLALAVTPFFAACCGTARDCPGIDDLPKVSTHIDVESPGFRERKEAALDSARAPRADERPRFLIDIHTHTFNANYLPLPEIIHVRTGNALTRYLVKTVARTLQVAAQPPYGGENSLRAEGDDAVRGEDLGEGDSVVERIDALVSTDEAESVRWAGDELERARDYVRGADDPRDEEERMSWSELRSDPRYLEGLEFLRRSQAVGWEAAAESLTAERGPSAWIRKVRSILPFLGALGTPDHRMPERYREQFRIRTGDANPRKVLMATQQGDFGPTYGARGTSATARGLKRRRYRDYGTVLLPAASALQALPLQDLLLFASYDPFVDGDGGLELAYDAVVKYGAVGLKYYPPSGSSPTGNPDPVRPGDRHLRNAWKSRYVESGKTLTGAQLDHRIGRFLDWCVESDLPLFTHSNPNEFEAERCYGYTFPHPAHWLRFLESDAAREKLRLCLGHASGPDFWFGTTDKDRPTADWGPIAAHMAMKYENVYIEMGVHDEVTDPEQRAHFVAVLESLEEQRREQGLPHSIADKILYGSDWFMPLEHASRAEYLDGYVEAMAILDARANGIDDWSERFFWRNALAYLNAERRLGAGVDVARLSDARPAARVALPDAVKADLAQLLDE